MTSLEKPEARLAKVASQTDSVLSEAILLRQECVARVCPAREEPCCSRMWLVFGEKDIIFAKVFIEHTVSSPGYE
jgi:hypothetical protein